ncbi:hypothetical protein NMY22_g13464 [Coprinellus aureogranulatus]|nr:hypothetical protein NMY22_g13464 [Coprinellus aureogranulatus]
MDPNQPFTPAQVAALRSFLQMMEAAGPAGGGNASQLPPTQPASSSLANNAPAPTPTPAPPITSLYQSHRLASQGHPAPQPSQPANGGFQFQPFVGANTLGLPLATTNVNQARMASASATIPRGPALQARQSRRRGPATAPPGLPHLGLTAEVRRVFVGDGSDLVRVTVKVHPGTSETHRFILFRFRNGSFNQYLTEHHLLYNMDLASSTTISSLMLDIASRMQSSPFLYKFDPSLVNSSVAGEDFRLRLLRLVGRGQPSGRTAAEITLTPEPVVGSMSIADMLQQKGKYVGANRVCLEGNPLRFVIHFAASSPWYTKGGRRHGPSCLVDHFQHLFPSDQQLVSIADDADTSGGEEIDDDDDDDAAEAEQSLMPSVCSLISSCCLIIY